MCKKHTLRHLIGVRDTSHTTHNAQDVIIYCVHTHLGSGRTRNGARGEHKLEDGIVNAREVARP